MNVNRRASLYEGGECYAVGFDLRASPEGRKAKRFLCKKEASYVDHRSYSMNVGVILCDGRHS